MRILLTYGRQPTYYPFGVHLIDAFRALGHEALLVPVRDRPWWGTVAKRWGLGRGRWRWDQVTWANHCLPAAVRRYRPDVVLEIEGDLFHADTLRHIKQHAACRFAVWLVEGPSRSGAADALTEYDVIASTSRIAMQQLHAAGFTGAAYMPFAMNPRWCAPARRPSSQPRYPVGFIGAYAERRARYLRAVDREDLHLWGPQWDQDDTLSGRVQSSRMPYGRAQVRSYQHTLVSLNIQREHMTHRTAAGEELGTGLSFRHFDAPACGSLLLTEWVEELPEAFAIGEEVDTFRTAEELREKTHFYLTHEHARQQVTTRGRARALRDHTWRHRCRAWLKLWAAMMLSVIAMLAPAMTLHAAVPHLIRYQGTLVDTQQVPLEGPYTLTFRLYDAATGGTKRWDETQTNVPITKGQFSVLLGQVTPLDLPFDKDLWLSIAVNTDAEMTPRQRLSSVPYAYRAAVAETAQNMKTSAIEDDGSKFVPTGGIILWTGASCPAGYTRVTEFDGKHVVGGATAGINQGNDTQSVTLVEANMPLHRHGLGNHTHTTPPHTHTISQKVGNAYQPPVTVASTYLGSADVPFTATGLPPGTPEGGGVTGPAVGTTDSAGSSTAFTFDNRPSGRTILLCQKQ